MSWWVFVSHSSKVKIKWFNLKSFNKKLWLKRNIFYIVTHIHIYIYTYLPIFLFAHLFFWVQLFSHPEQKTVLWKCVVFVSRQVQVSNIQDAMQLLDLPLEAGTSVTKDVVGTEDYDWSTYSPLTVGLFTIGFPKKKAGYEPLISGGRRLGGVGWPSMIKSFGILTVIYN